MTPVEAGREIVSFLLIVAALWVALWGPVVVAILLMMP